MITEPFAPEASQGPSIDQEWAALNAQSLTGADAAPAYANENPLTKAEIDAMFAGDQMAFTADDVKFLNDNGISARVEASAAEEAAVRRATEFTIGRLVTTSVAELSDEDDD